MNQSLDLVELILVDDGSVDNSVNIIDGVADLPNITVIHQKNAGVSAARNRGIEVATGEYLFFLDSDDYLESDVLEKLWQFAKEHDLDLVSCSHTEYNATLYNGNNSALESFVADGNEEIGRYFNAIFPKSACAKLFRSSLVEKTALRFPEEMRLGEDMYFTYSFILLVKKMGKVADAFYRIQNVNQLSLSKKYVPTYEADIEKQIKMWEQVVSRYPNAEQAYYEENMDMALSLSAGFFNNLYKQDCMLSEKEKRLAMRRYLAAHKEWIVAGGRGIKRPKNKLQIITMLVIKTRMPLLIGAFFKLKEQLKKRKFESGKNAAK
jgi:glycosyltransferase involved in cell wall biosynthesis